MNIKPHAQGIASILRTEIEAWRRATSVANVSREAVADMVMTAHQALGGEAATGVEFSFVGDTYTKAKKAAQKLYRWLDADGALPADMLPSILAALPMEQRLSYLSQILCPLGIEARQIGSDCDGGLDVPSHLRTVMKEGNEAQLALVTLSAAASETELLAAHNELVEAAQVSECAAKALMAEIVARRAVRQAFTSSSK
jgi:hypothetical protein